MPAYKKTPKGIKGHGRLGVEFDPSHAPREGYPKTAQEQRDRLDAEQARVSEMQRRKPDPKKMASGGCVGPECEGCSSAGCYAKGGDVNRETGHEKGVHTRNHEGPGSSFAGSMQRSNTSVPRLDRDQWAKESHHKVLGEMKSMKKPNLYAHGGEVDDDEFAPRETLKASHPEKHHKGVHESTRLGDKGVSAAGYDQRNGFDTKGDHKRVLGELKRMKKPHLYAEGGAVDSWTKREDNEKGVHRTFGSKKGVSPAGFHVRSENSYTPEQDKGESMESAKREHRKKLSEMKSMKKPNLYAEGGQVQDNVPEPNKKNAADMQKGATSGGPSAGEAWSNLKSGLGFSEGGEVADGEPEMDDELHQALGGEFMDALGRKDRKGIMSALEAIVLSCRGKE